MGYMVCTIGGIRSGFSPWLLTFRRFTGEGGEGEIHDVHADDSWLQQA